MPLNISIGTDVMWANTGYSGSHARIRTNQSVVANQSGRTVGWLGGGVLVDLHGDALAITELADGSGCPDDFVATSIDVDAAGKARETGLRPPAETPTDDATAPMPTGRWSASTLHELLSESP